MCRIKTGETRFFFVLLPAAVQAELSFCNKKIFVLQENRKNNVRITRHNVF